MLKDAYKTPPDYQPAVAVIIFCLLFRIHLPEHRLVFAPLCYRPNIYARCLMGFQTNETLLLSWAHAYEPMVLLILLSLHNPLSSTLFYASDATNLVTVTIVATFFLPDSAATSPTTDLDIYARIDNDRWANKSMRTGVYGATHKTQRQQ